MRLLWSLLIGLTLSAGIMLDAGSDEAYLAERRATVVYTNQQRVGLGLAALGTFDLLELAVQRYTVDLAAAIGATGDTCRHRTLDGRYSFDYAAALGIVGGGGEVVACGFSSGQAAVDAWLTSPPHRNIVTGSYNVVAYGHWRTPSGWTVWVGLFLVVDPSRYPIYVPTIPSPTLTPHLTLSLTPRPTPSPVPSLTPRPTPSPVPFARRGVAWVEFSVPGVRELFDRLCQMSGVRCWYYR